MLRKNQIRKQEEETVTEIKATLVTETLGNLYGIADHALTVYSQACSPRKEHDVDLGHPHQAIDLTPK